ncbi:MAG: hypothetical protein ACFFDK_16750 [Promethearchaeota archaeon]
MSLRENIIEKLYELYNSSDIPIDIIDRSENLLLMIHQDDLTIANLAHELPPKDIQRLKEEKREVARYNISEQRLLLSIIIRLLTTNLTLLHSKEERLEFYMSLPSIFKSVYETLYTFLQNKV